MKKKDLLNAKQMSLVFEISEKTIKQLAKEKEIPCEYINRRPHFKINAIIKHFERLEGGVA